MKNSKRILALLLCTLMVLALVPALSAYAESCSGTCGDNLTWILEDGVLSISGTGDMTNYDSERVVPWYDYHESIHSVIISNGVTSIGAMAFENCDALTSVTIPDGVTSIGDFAFGYSGALTSVAIPDSVTFIGDGAFYWCDALTSVTIPDSIISIAVYTFGCCSALTSITIPDSVTTIGNLAFCRCEALTDVYYSGSEDEWNSISIGERNDCLTNATIHYNSSSTDEISVTLNGSKITFDQQPIIIDGRTMVPLRAIFEALGASVDWDNTTQTVTAEKDGTIVKMTIGQTIMYVNGSPVTLDVAPQLVNSRTLVPARAVAESFNCNVDWNNDTRTVIITY